MGYSKVIQSGNVVEIYEYSKDLSPRKKRKRENKGRYSKLATRRGDNVLRLKKHFVRLVRANLGGIECPVFLTLTMVEVVRIELAYGFFTEFVSRVRRLYGKTFRYIAVPEFQERGAVHFHVLAWGLPKEIIENEVPSIKTIGEGGDIKLGEIKRGTRTLQRIWARGTVDCFLTDGSDKLAFYVSKYMSKALHDDRLLRQKAYVCSRNVMRPVSIPSSIAISTAPEIWGIDLENPLKEKFFDTQWLGRGRYRVYLKGS
jgi:hypothetical protein